MNTPLPTLAFIHPPASCSLHPLACCDTSTQLFLDAPAPPLQLQIEFFRITGTTSSTTGRPMKERKLKKTWDEVYPDDHVPNFKTKRNSMLDLNVKDILAKHWRSISATEAENLSSHRTWSQSFIHTNEGSSSKKERHTNRKQQSNSQLASLEKDVAELRSRFECEQAKRTLLEKTLQKASPIPSHQDLTPKKIQDLVEEIAMLELEVSNLEQHLLKLYQQAFARCFKSSTYNCRSLNSYASGSTQAEQLQNKLFTGNWRDIPQRSSIWVREESQKHTNAHDFSTKASTLPSSHSQPISFPQGTPFQDNFTKCFVNSRQRTLAEKKPTNAANRLSEELVRCMSAIYCRLAHPPVLQHEPETSPSSSFSASTFSAQGLWSDRWSLQHKNDMSYEGSCDENNYTTEIPFTFEVRWICVDDERLADAATMLHNFRSLVQQLEGVDPSKMDHEQKLAFWINVHNTLVMHAYLAYGIPGNQLKRILLLQKAAYRIGEHMISAQTIEQSILKCRSYRPAKWLHSFLPPAATAAGILRGEDRRKYAIQHPEPLLCFALCWGARSDPAVRVYTHKLIYLQLECAKQEFLDANVSVQREGKVCLPSILEPFAKQTSMKSSQLLEWISNHVDGQMATFIDLCNLHAKGKAHRCIQWLQYDFTFRYVFSSSLAI